MALERYEGVDDDLGHRKGDVVERVMPGGLRRLLIEEVLQAAATDGIAAEATQGGASVH